MTRILLADAHNYLLPDSAVRNMLGDSISLGLPNLQSSSNSMVIGVTKSRLQLFIPISGSQATGRIRLVANQFRVITVPLDKQRRPDEVIDAEVLIIQTNSHYSAATYHTIMLLTNAIRKNRCSCSN